MMGSHHNERNTYAVVLTVLCTRRTQSTAYNAYCSRTWYVLELYVQYSTFEPKIPSGTGTNLCVWIF